MEIPKKKKILFVITKSNWGGAQRYVFDLATGLAKKADVRVALGGVGAANAREGLLAKRLRDAGIATYFVKSFMRDISVWRECFALYELVRLFRDVRPDVVHVNSSKAGGIGALAAHLVGVERIVFTVHGWPFAESRNIVWRAGALAGSWATALLCHTVIVITQLDLARGRLLPFCGAKMRLIYNGIDRNMPLGSGDVVRSAFPPGATITGTIGELTRNKNQIALVERARHDPEMYVAIVGEGEDRPMLEAKIRAYRLGDRVKLFGFVPASEALRGFDTFALPSLKEGLPYVLLEARAAGLPLEANRVGGVGDILDAPDMSQFSLEEMIERTAALY